MKFKKMSLKDLQVDLICEKAKLKKLNAELEKIIKNRTCGSKGVNLGMYINPCDYRYGDLNSDSSSMYHMVCADIKKDITKTEKRIKKLEDEINIMLQPSK